MIRTLAVLAMVLFPQNENRLYTQTYDIYIRGELTGTERVHESPDKDGNLLVESEHEILLTDGRDAKRIAFKTSMTLARNSGRPLHYVLRYTSGTAGDYYEVRTQGEKIHRILSRGSARSEVAERMSPETVIFDFNVYHQYDLLARRYDFKKGGRQIYRNFIPLVGAEVPLALTHLDDGELEYARGKVSVRHFRIELSGVFSGAFSVDKDLRLVRLLIQEKDLEVLRHDLSP